MATFAQLKDVMRREVVAEIATDFFNDSTNLYPMLYDAAAKIAAELGFPRKTNSALLSAPAQVISTPSDLLEIVSLSIGNWNLERTDYQTVLLRRSLAGVPNSFAHDAARAGVSATVRYIDFAPAISADVLYQLEYVAALAAPVTTSDAWGGLYPQFHHLIPLRAGVNAWAMAEDYERMSEFQKRYAWEEQGFKRFLGIEEPQQ